MAKTTVIQLSEIREGFNGKFDRVVVREPTLREVFQFGEPIEVSRTKDGQVVAVEHLDVLKNYLDILIVEPDSAIQVSGLPLTDALRVKDAIVDFFYRARLSISEISQTGQSSTPGS